MAIRKRKIQALTTALLEANNITDGPVPVAQIAQTRGARIFLSSLDGGLSGFLYRDSNESVIGVNTSHPAARQNFTIAHELGHLMLHDQEEQLHVDHEFKVRLRNDVSSQGIDEAEQEANFFAASILMPKEFLDRDLQGAEFVDFFDDESLRNLAKKYGVSTQALAIRLKTLGYIQG
jgi:Zn-dependent peptidase ImmA (M78 family)